MILNLFSSLLSGVKILLHYTFKIIKKLTKKKLSKKLKYPKIFMNLKISA